MNIFSFLVAGVSLFLNINWQNIWYNSREVLFPPPNLVAGGDIMLSRAVGYNIKKYWENFITNEYNPFSKIPKNSLIFVNLESPFLLPDLDKNEATFYFGANPGNVKILQWLRSDHKMVVSLANNHIFNGRFSGFQKTLDTLKWENFLTVGLSKDEREKFIIIKKSLKNYCIGAYTYDGREYFDVSTHTKWFVNSLSDAKNDIFEMQKSDCDEKIFLLHWGAEYRVEPSESQRKLAYFLIDNWATVIFGGHSHIFGKTEKYKNAMIFYSLWNFIFDQNWGKNSCQNYMDCVFDEEIQRLTVPTYIGTSVQLSYPYSDFLYWQHNIFNGKMSERVKNISLP